MDDGLTNHWFDSLFRTEEMLHVFSDRARLDGILRFEAALARAQASAGEIPQAAADVIVGQCRAERFDVESLAKSSAQSGNSAIPVINALTKLVAEVDVAAASYVHWGATSQDAMDTGLLLQLRDGLELIRQDTRQLAIALATLAKKHRDTAMVGRTWMQHAAPITFGLKAAGWLGLIQRSLERIDGVQSCGLALQFGGAVGTLAAHDDAAEETTSRLAKELQLPPAELPWHTQRDRLAEIATTLGLFVGSLGKIAGDVALLSQTEVAEVAEPAAPGRGSSSSMPQKRNPIGSAVVLAAATRVPALVSVMLSAMRQEHERGLGGWQAEWETLPEVFLLAAGALRQMCHVMSGLHVDAERMQFNLGMTRGLVYAESISNSLSRKIGRTAAHQLVEGLCRKAATEQRHLREIAAGDAEIGKHLSAAELESLFDAREHVRAAALMVDRSLRTFENRLGSSATEDATCPSPK